METQTKWELHIIDHTLASLSASLQAAIEIVGVHAASFSVSYRYKYLCFLHSYGSFRLFCCLWKLLSLLKLLLSLLPLWQPLPWCAIDVSVCTSYQGFESGSGSALDAHFWRSWIWIRICNWKADPDPYPCLLIQLETQKFKYKINLFFFFKGKITNFMKNAQHFFLFIFVKNSGKITQNFFAFSPFKIKPSFSKP